MRTKLLLVLGVVVGACIAAFSWAVYAAFDQPLAGYGFLVGAIVALVVARIAFIDKMMPSKRKAGEQANF